jgi:hypothetical protein
MKINTELCCKRYDFFLQKRPKTIAIRIIVWMTIFKSIHMGFYVNTSWACALFRNNKQHVVLGQKRNCWRVEESGLWRIQRERWIEVKYFPNGTNAGDKLDRRRWMERTQGSAMRQISRWSGKDFAWLLLIGKPSMLPSFLNRFSYFMNLWWCLWSFSVDINQYM